tara:strand:- start:91 stop:669 length:579 start_codon:yes stop_codon:yes gene_type:complete
MKYAYIDLIDFYFMIKLNLIKKGFTLVELLIVVAILGVLAAVGVTTFSGFINKSKINASKANHKQVFNLVAAKSMQCTLGEESVKYLDINGEPQEASCPISIDAFVSIMNQNLYSLNINSPYWGTNPPFGSWCKINVTNCFPPGYLDGCPDDKRMTGKIAIYKSSETDISVCTNVGIENNTAVLLLEKIPYK